MRHFAIKKYLVRSIFVIGMGICGLASASNLFAGYMTVDGVTQYVAYNSISDAINAFSDGGISKIFSNYNADTSTVSGNLDLRGLPATFSYSGSTLNFSVPSVGVNEVFTGSSRDDTDTQLKNWFKGNSGSAITTVLRGTVAQTPFDPIGGNPTSLMALMIGRSYSLGGQAWQGADGISKNQGLFTIQPTYVNDQLSGNRYQSMTLPITYARYFNSGRTAFFIDLPIQASRVGNANTNTYTAMLGLGLQQTVTQYWALTPSVYAGGAGSLSLGSAALAYSAAIKSRLHTDMLKRFSMGLNNVVGYLHTIPVSLNGYSVNYDLHNWAFANGIDARYMLNSKTAMKGYYTNTYFNGSPWYIKDYNELGLQWERIHSNFGLYSTRVYFGGGYLFGSHGFCGFNAKIGATF